MADARDLDPDPLHRRAPIPFNSIEFLTDLSAATGNNPLSLPANGHEASVGAEEYSSEVILPEFFQPGNSFGH